MIQNCRLLIGHQATGRHVILSKVNDWRTDGFCSGHCTRDLINSNSKNKGVSVITVDVHTRRLGTLARIDVQYNNGSRCIKHAFQVVRFHIRVFFVFSVWTRHFWMTRPFPGRHKLEETIRTYRLHTKFFQVNF